MVSSGRSLGRGVKIARRGRTATAGPDLLDCGSATGDVRVEERPDPEISAPTDAIIRVSAACVCGSDLWPYRGVEELEWPAPMGHEYAGIVAEVGADVETVKPGQF